MQNIHVRPEINASIWVFWKVLYPSHFPPWVKCPVSRDVPYSRSISKELELHIDHIFNYTFSVVSVLTIHRKSIKILK